MKKNNKNNFTVLTLGCSKNVVDSENLIGLLEQNGMKYTEEISDSDSVIINTCGFIKPSKEESVNVILDAISLKQKGILKKLVVSGCLTERYQNELYQQLPEVDSFFGVNSAESILKFLKPDYKDELLGERHLLTPKHYAYLKISEGCNHECAFCAIPNIRGRHISVPIEKVLADAQNLAAKGVKEISVIAQDSTYYGKDLYGRQMLPELLEKISEIKGIEWIRLMYAYPVAFPDNLLETIAKNPKICNYLDIPFQHISDKILKKMGRGSTRNMIEGLIEKIRTTVPDVAIRSTFIVGFPGESEKDFNELCDFLENAKLDRVGVFTYSHEDGTSAFKFKNDVPEIVKQQRRNYVMELLQKNSKEMNHAKIGRILKVIVDNFDGENYIGRSIHDAPEVDQSVFFKSKKEYNPGDFVDVKITKSYEYDLIGKDMSK